MLRAIACLLGMAISTVSGMASRGTQDGWAQRVWHTEDGLPEETVQAFAQTPDHFLWIGTSGGLVRFDGAQFVVFDRDNTSAFRENSVFCLLASANGTLWIGTEGGGLISYSDGVFRSWSKAQGLTSAYVRALRQDRKGDIWIGTDDGLFRLHNRRIERMDGRNGMPPISVHAIYEDREQRLWFGGFHLFVLTGNHMSEMALPGGLFDNVKSIVQTRDGTIWAGTVSGLSRMRPNARNCCFERIASIHSTVRSLLEDDSGTLWIGTIGEGLIRYQDEKFSASLLGSKLPSNTVLSSFLGSDRSLWIGTQTGLARLNKTPVSTLTLPDFADADFGTIYQDRDGALWVGSSHLFRLTGERVELLKFPFLGSARVRNRLPR